MFIHAVHKKTYGYGLNPKHIWIHLLLHMQGKGWQCWWGYTCVAGQLIL